MAEKISVYTPAIIVAKCDAATQLAHFTDGMARIRLQWHRANAKRDRCLHRQRVDALGVQVNALAQQLDELTPAEITPAEQQK